MSSNSQFFTNAKEFYLTLFEKHSGGDPAVEEFVGVLKTTHSQKEARDWFGDNFQRFNSGQREAILHLLQLTPTESQPTHTPSQRHDSLENSKDEFADTDPQTKALLIFALMRLHQLKETLVPIIRDAYFQPKKRKRFLKETGDFITTFRDSMLKDQPTLFNHPKYKRAFDEFETYVTEARIDLSKLP